MLKRRALYSLLALGAFTIVPLLVPRTGGAATPKAPPSLCAGSASNCVTTTIATLDGIKWHPGHYLKTQGNQAQSNQAAYLADVSDQITKTLASDMISGALVSYSWESLEPKLGQYDWSPIYKHLNYLAAHNKRLMILVQYKCFSNSCPDLAPAELQPKGSCSPAPCESGDVWFSGRAAIVEMWKPEVMDAYIAMLKAMAAQFDSNPNVEMIVTPETSPSLAGTHPPTYSIGALANQLERLYSALGGQWQKTMCMPLINYLGQKVSGLVEAAYQAGCAVGGPDVEDTAGNVVFRGGSMQGNNAVRDYRGLIPHMEVVSSPTLAGRNNSAADSPSKVLSWGAQNGVTHYVWVGTSSGEDSWSSIISTVEAQDQRTAALSCPTKYSNRCNAK